MASILNITCKDTDSAVDSIVTVRAKDKISNILRFRVIRPAKTVVEPEPEPDFNIEEALKEATMEVAAYYPDNSYNNYYLWVRVINMTDPEKLPENAGYTLDGGIDDMYGFGGSVHLYKENFVNKTGRGTAESIPINGSKRPEGSPFTVYITHGSGLTGTVEYKGTVIKIDHDEEAVKREWGITD